MKWQSRKLAVAVSSLSVAIATAYSDIDPEVISQLYDFLGKLVTFYLIGQGAVDVSGRIKGFKD